jgi:ATP-dependent helicase HrpB
MKPSGLPIDAVLADLRAALVSGRSAVLQAPPGAGKSTVVPLALLSEAWLAGRKIVMLEPRRLAARAVAQRMARSLDEQVGQTVGYRMRLDTRVSRATRIEVVTEGVLTRMLQSDASLEGVGIVIFDEFHERSLQADIGLALTLDAREALTPELRVLLMSATLDGERAAAMVGDAAIVTAQGRMFSVESRFAGKGAPVLPGTRSPTGGWESPERIVAQLVSRALREEEGDVLVFLPGAGEIRRVQGMLESEGGVRVLPLYGELSPEDQDAALTPGGKRKVVLATNIAETSLTIEGIRIVVDSGLVRRSLFDPSTGMSRLETQRISRASAEQRQGRAGRLEAGVCYRAWSEGAHRSLAPFTPPEILDADLAPLALELAAWGAREAGDLRWQDAPPAAMLSSARDLLMRLGALDTQGRITEHGREMSRLGVHPRLAHMLLRARKIRAIPLAAMCAALLSERDILRTGGGSGAGDAASGASGARNSASDGGRAGHSASARAASAASAGPDRGRRSPGAKDVDVRTRLELMRGDAGAGQADRGGLQRARRFARDLARQMNVSLDDAGRDDSDAGLLFAFAYPDRIGQRRAGVEGRYTLANGRGAHFAEAQSLAREEFIVAIDLDDRERDARILLAAPIAKSALEEHFADRMQRTESVEWDSREQAVLARRVVRLDALVLDEKPLRDASTDAMSTAMLAGIRELGIAALPWSRDARDLQARLEFLRRLDEGEIRSGANTATATSGRVSIWPAVNDAALAESLDAWLAPWLEGITRRDHLARISLIDALRALLPWEQQRKLDELAPTHLEVPTGSRIRIDYLDESAPAVSVRLQEVFGLEQTPRIGGGRVPLTFKLLSPAQRPVQVTRDLASFWRGAYAEVRKDMRGRYPKHYWPENPLEAEPTRGVRRR